MNKKLTETLKKIYKTQQLNVNTLFLFFNKIKKLDCKYFLEPLLLEKIRIEIINMFKNKFDIRIRCYKIVDLYCLLAVLLLKGCNPNNNNNNNNELVNSEVDNIVLNNEANNKVLNSEFNNKVLNNEFNNELINIDSNNELINNEVNNTDINNDLIITCNSDDLKIIEERLRRLISYNDKYKRIKKRLLKMKLKLKRINSFDHEIVMKLENEIHEMKKKIEELELLKYFYENN
ncbi:hypothetical protein DMUE_4117 [Dictyocoela muelleri]|nr:hypothetical protein DMUE_4117 [Dictyocoela muelleri]